MQTTFSKTNGIFSNLETDLNGDGVIDMITTLNGAEVEDGEEDIDTDDEHNDKDDDKDNDKKDKKEKKDKDKKKKDSTHKDRKEKNQ